MTSTYWFQDSSELIDYQEGNYGSFEYGRYGNPTTKACEENDSSMPVTSSKIPYTKSCTICKAIRWRR